jgi:Ca2+-binding RTX toxin-like protein
LHGGLGNDQLFGIAGDNLFGDGGNDLLDMDGALSDVSDATLLDGGDGFDTAVVNLGVPTGSAPTVVDQ